MKKLSIVIIIAIILYIAYMLISRDSTVDFSSKQLEITNAPQSVKDWIHEVNSEKVHLCRGEKDNKMIIYLYIPNIIVGQQHKRYETINIKPIQREGIEISINYKLLGTPNQTLIEIAINKPRIKYIILDDEVIDIKSIPIINISN